MSVSPYRTLYGNNVKTASGGSREYLRSMVEENAVIVFASKGCCMCHVAKRLLQLVGANPAVYEVDTETDLDDVARVAHPAEAQTLQLPAVFIGGRWFGGLERIIATHIAEELAPLLRRAGALWL